MHRSLAVTMYYCLSGSHPFAPDAAATVESIRSSIMNDQPQHVSEATQLCNATISSHTVGIVMKNLKKKMNDRFPSAKTMLKAVLSAMEWVRRAAL